MKCVHVPGPGSALCFFFLLYLIYTCIFFFVSTVNVKKSVEIIRELFRSLISIIKLLSFCLFFVFCMHIGFAFFTNNA